ncbi:hypothetical protein Poli38472_000024 [Pythium oligandrum]|uniref:SAM-dependent MTase RsmB/NOP-type domain-containing protein n=1 Tax=Pythium oligandrum TaxID=41045 RepID=A0A8K1CCU7_PYTOL|nr:hypothetical protein Poli38472_000024 [Pythium oligandrum]|eukprot:TMW59982.1 hypothetical protein Poli38472_000024 [Pythium oligandrum]
MAMSSTGEAPTKTALEVYKQSFREYLWETHVVSTEEELDQLVALLHEPLPVSFRLNLHHPDTERVKKLLATDFQFPSNQYFHGNIPVDPPKPIPWYPLSNVAWQMDCGRVALSKTAPKYADIKKFHACLLESTEMGTIDRQEAVSMLPVLFLNVQPGHRVLDMCASPGSKTTQALDFLADSSNSDATSTPLRGMVVANDLDKKRAYMLVHRLSRNTLRNAVVTCGSGITFPGLYDAASKTLQPTNVFDRVLCDVPCSGDGTLRKSQTLWKEWHIGQGLTLHPTQLSLGLRGAALLKVGGVMVYSTCSFNPIENEAVVAELLRRCDGALELLDVSSSLPSLIYRKGRTQWPVGWRSKSKSTHKGHVFNHAKSGEEEAARLHDWYSSYADLPQELRGQRVVRSMFPPTSAEAIAELEKTLRLVPIDQNSGGFFIAVLRKTRDLPGENQEGLAPLDEEIAIPPPEYVCKLCGEKGHFMKNCAKYLPEDTYEAGPKPTKKRRTDEEQTKTEKARETLYRPISDEAWTMLQTFYGITDSALRARFWCRSDSASTVNYVDEDIVGSCLGGDALEIVNTGLRVFTKVTERGEAFYRPTEEALGFIERFLNKRLLTFTRGDLEQMLGGNAHTPFTSLSSIAQSALTDATIGPAVAQLDVNKNIAINVWIGNGAVLPRVSKTMKSEVALALQRME